jgi:glutaminyl-tRNA synthetase
MPFGRELWIEREDFMVQPSKGYHRLYPGNMARLRYGYVVKLYRFRA